MGQHILSGSVFPGNQHSGVRRRDFLYVASEPLHHHALAPEHPRPLVSRFNLWRSLFLVPYSRKCFNQFRVLPRLYDKILRSALHPFHRECDVRISREQHHSLLRPPCLYLRQPEKSLVPGVDVRLEVHVQQNHVRSQTLHRPHQRHRRRQRLHPFEAPSQQYLQRFPDPLIVIDNQYFPLFQHNNPQFTLISPNIQKSRNVLP